MKGRSTLKEKCQILWRCSTLPHHTSSPSTSRKSQLYYSKFTTSQIYYSFDLDLPTFFFSLSLFFGFVNIRKESTNWRWRYFWHSNFCRILLPLINDTLRISYTKSAPELELTLNPNPYNPLIPSPFFFLFFSTARIDWPTYTFVVVLNVKLIINHAISDLLFPFTPFVFFPSPILFYYFLIPACSTNTVAGFFFLSLLSLYI